ncbi:MAG: hypothetical protein ACYDE0_15045 [Acidiferrobacterales bacterium]
MDRGQPYGQPTAASVAMYPHWGDGPPAGRSYSTVVSSGPAVGALREVARLLAPAAGLFAANTIFPAQLWRIAWLL